MAVTYMDIMSPQAGATGHNGTLDGATVVTSPAPKRSEEKYTLKVTNLGTGSLIGHVRTDKFDDTGADFLHAFTYFRLPALDPENTSAGFFECWADTSGATHWSLRWNSSGDMILRSASGSTIATVSGMFSVDEWFKVRVKWKRGNSAAIDVWVDEVNKISETGQDLQSGAGDDIIIVQGNGSNQASVINVFHGSGGVAKATLTGDVVFEDDVLALVNDGYIDVSQGSATQWTGTQNLSSGRWDNMDDLSDATFGKYSITTNGQTLQGGVTTDGTGLRDGPRTITPNAVLGASWLWRFQRISTTRRGTEISSIGLYGQQVNGSESTKNTTEMNLVGAIDTISEDRKFAGVDASEVPAADEWFQIGAKTALGETGGIGDLAVYHMSCLIFVTVDFQAKATARFVCVNGVVISV